MTDSAQYTPDQQRRIAEAYKGRPDADRYILEDSEGNTLRIDGRLARMIAKSFEREKTQP